MGLLFALAAAGCFIGALMLVGFRVAGPLGILAFAVLTALGLFFLKAATAA